MNVQANDPVADTTPYRPPQEVSEPIRSFQTKLLRELVDYRQHPSTPRMLMQNWKRMVLIFGYAAFVAAIPRLLGMHSSITWISGSFAFGFWLTATASIVGQCRARKRAWPTIDQIIDWESVDRLLDQNNN